MSDKFEITPQSRRQFIKTVTGSAAAAAAVFGGFGINPALAAEGAMAVGMSRNRSRRPSPMPACRRLGAPKASRRPSTGASFSMSR